MVNDDTPIPESDSQRAGIRSVGVPRPATRSPRRWWGTLIPLVAVGSLTITACGDDDEEATSSTTTTTDQNGEAGEGGTTTTSDDDGGGEEFTDPQGLYRLRIDPAWTAMENPQLGPEGESWQVAETVDGLTPNLGLAAEPNGGLELEGFLDDNLATSDVLEEFELIDRRTVDGEGGTPLGILDFTARVQDVPMHFLSATFVDGDQAVSATLAVPADRFDEVRSSVEPFILTLQPA